MNHVVKIGMEVEGGWTGGGKKKSPFMDATIHQDASVPDFGAEFLHYGEIASDPMPPDRKIYEKWLVDHYPQTHNDRCGFHVHASVKNARVYGQLATRKFFDFWREETNRWAKEIMAFKGDHLIWHRLQGRNRYCAMVFSAVNQMRKKTKPPNDPERRTALNFAWGLHKTIENRVYPMFMKPSEAADAVEAYVGIINRYLDQVGEGKDFFEELSLGPGDLD